MVGQDMRFYVLQALLILKIKFPRKLLADSLSRGGGVLMTAAEPLGRI